MGGSDIMEDEGNDSKGSNRGSHNNKGRNKGAGAPDWRNAARGG